MPTPPARRSACLAVLATAAGLFAFSLPAAAEETDAAAVDSAAPFQLPEIEIDSELGIPDPESERLRRIIVGTLREVGRFPLPIADPSGEKARVIIRASRESYIEAGGIEGSAGRYLGRSRTVVIDASFLLDDRTTADPAARQALLVHEAAHLAMHTRQRHMPQWLVEGLCEWFAAAHTGGGDFQEDAPHNAIRRHLLRRYQLRPPATIDLLPIADITKLSPEEWDSLVDRLPVERKHHAYTTALLLTHYLVFGGAERREWVRELVEDAATPRPRGRRSARVEIPSDLADALEESAAIEDALTRFWRQQALTLRFTPAGAGD